jgi:hypothetical protein
MELDDLKKTWKESTIQKPQNKNIMEMIQHKSYGPIAALKRSYRKQIIVMAFLPFLLLLTNMDDILKPLTSILFWSYVILCIGIIAFAIYNYRIVEKMQTMDKMVKQNLAQQITILETSLRWKIIGLRIALLFFILLTEVVPYFQHYSMLNKWHSLPVLIRFSSYAAIIIIQYFLSPIVLKRKFGRHLEYLKELAKDL